MASQWYYAIGDTENGPVSSQALKNLADSGQLSQKDQVWKEGMAEWVDAGAIPNLFKDAPAAPGAAPSPTPAATPTPTIAPAPAPASGAPVINTGDTGAPTISTGAPTVGTGAAGAPVIGTGAPVIGTGAPGAPVISGDQPSPSQRAGGAAPGRRSSGAGNVAQQAGLDALEAFKNMASDPVGGLSAAYERLGAQRALYTGIVFGIIFAICPTIAAGMLMKTMAMFRGARGMGSIDIEMAIYLKIFLVALVLPLAFSGGCALSRLVFGGKNGYESDLFIASASLLPIALLILLAGLIGEALGPQVIAALLVFAESTTVLMLYSGSTRIHRIPDRAATLAVPSIIVVGFLGFYLVMKMFFMS